MCGQGVFAGQPQEAMTTETLRAREMSPVRRRASRAPARSITHGAHVAANPTFVVPIVTAPRAGPDVSIGACSGARRNGGESSWGPWLAPGCPLTTLR